jgi:hypothetical protein
MHKDIIFKSFIVFFASILYQTSNIMEGEMCQMELNLNDYFHNTDNVINTSLVAKYIENRTTGSKQKIPYFIFQTH